MLSTTKMLSIGALSALLQLTSPVQVVAQEVATKAFSIRTAGETSLQLTSAQKEMLRSLGFTDIFSKKTLGIYFELFIDSELQFISEDLQKTYFTADAKKQLSGEAQQWIEENMGHFYGNIHRFLQEKDPLLKLQILEDIFQSQDAIFLLSMILDTNESKMFFREKKTGPLFQKIAADFGENLEAIFDGKGDEGVQKRFQKTIEKKGEKYILAQFESIFGALTYYPNGVPKELYKVPRIDTEVASREKTPRKIASTEHRERRDVGTSKRRKKETSVATNGSFSLFGFLGFTGN